MRQALFAVMVVAAAFLGGAVVNGPGVRWLQARFVDYMGLRDGGEIASIDLVQESLPRVDADSRQTPNSAVGNAVSEPPPPPLRTPTNVSEPSIPAPTLPATPRDLPKSGAKPQSHVKGARPTTTLVESQVASNQVLTTNGGAGPSRLAVPTRPKSSARPDPEITEWADQQALPAPLDPSVGPALLASLLPQAGSEPVGGGQAGSASIALEVAPARAATASAPSMAGSPSRMDNTGFIQFRKPLADWVGLHHKLQSLGVTRYTVEGVPGGRAVFSCVIPLAGRQAVSQRFEAEADNELHAAQSVIRRIVLWQATHSESGVAR
jgi:hypothetical protein